MAPLVAMLDDAGLVEVYTDAQGRETYRLRDDDVRVGWWELPKVTRAWAGGPWAWWMGVVRMLSAADLRRSLRL